MPNPFVHVELNTTDLGQAKVFYGQLFDWKFESFPMENGEYLLLRVGEGTGGGMMQNPLLPGHSLWLAYVQVDDIEAATAKARSLGATIVVDVTQVAEAGWFSIIEDPTGAKLGLWKRNTTPAG
jgi:predicted enzyme related to lactoylglutathione lyase